MATTLAQLKTRARQRADMENSQFIGDSELTSYINASYAELYDLLIQTHEDYFTTSTDFTLTSSDNGVRAMGVTVAKFRGLDWLNGSDYIPLKTYSWNERGRSWRNSRHRAYRLVGDNIMLTPASGADGTYKMWYVPAITPLSLDADTIVTPVSRNNWEEYIVIDVAMKLRDKEESDISTLMQQKQQIITNIRTSAANRDLDQPARVASTRGYFAGETDDDRWWLWP